MRAQTNTRSTLDGYDPYAGQQAGGYCFLILLILPALVICVLGILAGPN